MRLVVLIVVFCLGSLTTYGQGSINGYKYINVPSKFDFLKSKDKYQLNSLTKFLFKKEGFIVVSESEKVAQELYNNPCLGLKANVSNHSNMFSTKVVLELVDCRDDIIFTSIEGKSKDKDFKKGFQEALRAAFVSIKDLEYKYDSSLTIANSEAEDTNIKNAIPLVEGETHNAEVFSSNGEKIESTRIADEVTEKDEPEVIETSKIEEVESTAVYVPENKKDTRDRDGKGNVLGFPTDKVLYAQENVLGYQLVDSDPKIVFVLLKSGDKDKFYLKNRSGNFFKNGDKWYAEYYFDGHLIKQEFEVKW